MSYRLSGLGAVDPPALTSAQRQALALRIELARNELLTAQARLLVADPAVAGPFGNFLAAFNRLSGQALAGDATAIPKLEKVTRDARATAGAYLSAAQDAPLRSLLELLQGIGQETARLAQRAAAEAGKAAGGAVKAVVDEAGTGNLLVIGAVLAAGALLVFSISSAPARMVTRR